MKAGIYIEVDVSDEHCLADLVRLLKLGYAGELGEYDFEVTSVDIPKEGKV